MSGAFFWFSFISSLCSVGVHGAANFTKNAVYKASPKETTIYFYADEGCTDILFRTSLTSPLSLTDRCADRVIVSSDDLGSTYGTVVELQNGYKFANYDGMADARFWVSTPDGYSAGFFGLAQSKALACTQLQGEVIKYEVIKYIDCFDSDNNQTSVVSYMWSVP
mmetsp:Transcript_20845/g.29361  ORF Transcript_20845/g.29361 Transcript_20845/m.29361 type:complete len:165 (+) Transcript_20845:38-532(+)|eukprot:CAMPEP_0175102730 /NCGR_PEP_ID=MMETSP0086_2-20121207/8632_1 /TAXON_ID=136419 /ORGANISM="Unknown Unknown, Strain D1" /LENGTH=164 /DNA_ID=CAMNT_0016377639 /DNA_START=33 /DNA_END=527 /DNA_ORIENTATION=-